MSPKYKGYACGIIAAITYGTNPLGALNLYAEGVNVNTVIFYRYGLATVILAGLMLAQKTSFAIRKHDLWVCLALGVTFAISSLSLFTSFHYMDAGIACTILFLYPVIVAVIMAVFFKERVALLTALSIVLALAGIALLYKGESGAVLSTIGVVLCVVSAVSYATYVVVINKADLSLSPIKLTFFVMLFGGLTILAHSLLGGENRIHLLTTATQWMWVSMMALVPTIISLVLMAISVRTIGSTPTAIMGALEPVTAVIIGVAVFDESFTLRIAAGMAMILGAVIIIIVEKPLAKKIFGNKRASVRIRP
ncbi:MAG: DMT family transporter [Planctomycetaceae bacterium]|nr:DMT family transporter [Planctomycetaceae bacterium]